MPRCGSVTLVVCLLMALTSGWSAAAESPVRSNLDVMHAVTTQVGEDLISGFPATVAGRELRLVPLGKDERYEFVANVLTQSLTAKGYRTYAPVSGVMPDTAGSGPPSGSSLERSRLRLEFQVIDFSIGYPKIYRSYLIGGKKVKRSADVRLMTRLVDPADGLVIWTGEASRSYADDFSYGAIAHVEEGVYQFTKPPHESRKWGRIIEPIVVTGIVVGLIYLFFSNQGN